MRLSSHGKFPARWHDADNGVIASRERDFFADDIGIAAESALPELVRDDDDAAEHLRGCPH